MRRQNYKTPQLELVGHRSGKLVAIKKAGVNRDNRILWRCKCDCGEETLATATALKAGLNKSCGCLRRSPKGRVHDGRSVRAEYRAWQQMRQRCSPWAEHRDHRLYAARGIRVCAEWDGPGGFDAFFAHIGPRPSPRHSVDRIDNDLGYEPGNVRWATAREQSANTRAAHLETVDGETLCVSEWARRAGLKVATVHSRLAAGMDIRGAISPGRLPRGRRAGH